MSVTKEFQCSEALSSVVIIVTWKLFFKVVLGLNKKKNKQKLLRARFQKFELTPAD